MIASFFLHSSNWVSLNSVYTLYYTHFLLLFQDNVAYFSCKQLDIELYTDKKQPELEEQVESVLSQHEIYYTKTETFIDSEELYEVLYEMEV